MSGTMEVTLKLKLNGPECITWITFSVSVWSSMNFCCAYLSKYVVLSLLQREFQLTVVIVSL